MKELVIEKDKVVHNIQVIQKKAQGASLIAVLKACLLYTSDAADE